MEWCAATSKYRCVRCGKEAAMPGTCGGPTGGEKTSTVGWKKEKHALGRARHGKRHGSGWRGIGAVHDVLGSWSVPTGAEINAPL